MSACVIGGLSSKASEVDILLILLRLPHRDNVDFLIGFSRYDHNHFPNKRPHSKLRGIDP